MFLLNIRSIAIEMYKVKNGLSPEIMNEIFQLTEGNYYNLCQTFPFMVPHVSSIFKRSESVSFFGAKIWELKPSEIK